MTYRITSDTGENHGEWCGKNAEGALLAMHRSLGLKVDSHRDDWKIRPTASYAKRVYRIYRITSTAGAPSGIWVADSEAEALLAMHRDAGCGADIVTVDAYGRMAFADDGAPEGAGASYREMLGGIDDWNIECIRSLSPEEWEEIKDYPSETQDAIRLIASYAHASFQIPPGR
jgi:hypothetical protein